MTRWCKASTAFFVGCMGPSWPSQSATESSARRWPVAEPAERWLVAGGAAGGTPIRGAGVPGTSGCREGVRITMGAGDAVFMKRSIFCRIVETQLNGHARGCIVIHGRRCGRWHGGVRCAWTHEGDDAGEHDDMESPWPSPSRWTIPPLPNKLRHGDRNTGRGQAFASRGLEIMRGGLFGCNTNPG